MHRFYLVMNVIMALIVCIGLTACQTEDTFLLTDMDSVTEDTSEYEDNPEIAESESKADESPEADLMPAEYIGNDILERTETAEIYVFICGQVENPGVYCLPEGSRICDAVEMAGGCLDTADINAVNQAERLTDGAKIYIPAIGEEPDSGMAGASGLGASESENSDLLADSQSGMNSGKLNINLATREELMTLPGIGETKADAILEYRDSHGSFTSIEELMNIAGIKEGVFNKIEEYIMVE